MPHTDGFVALDFLKEHQPGMLASVSRRHRHADARRLDRARSYGVCDIIVKPFEVETLLAAVKKCVYPDGGNGLGPILYTGGPMIFLLADLLRQRLLS